jgi:hypothetical protein
MRPLHTGRALPSISAGPYCFEQLTLKEKSVAIILSDAAGNADTNALIESLHQLQFRIAFMGAVANASLPSARVPNSTDWPVQGPFDDLPRLDAVISFSDDALPLLKPALLHLRASVHVAETAPAFIEIFQSLNQSMGSMGRMRNDVTLPPCHQALLIETGPSSEYSSAIGCYGQHLALRVIRVKGTYRTRPYTDPLIIELARRHLEMWA